LQDALFLLFENGKLVMIEDGLGKESLIEEGVESFVVLPTGHFLIKKININQSIVWKRDHPPQILDSNPLAVLPFTNCMTLLSLNTDCRNFSLSSPIQSKFLLPNLFEGDPEIIDKWIEDPLFPTAMEFILLAGSKNPDIFKVLKVHMSDDPRLQAIVSRSVASISRKIEIDEAINSLFVHFSSITVLSHLRMNETINFLPFLAKAFDITGKDEFLDTIKRALNELFSKRKNYPHITRIQEYFEAFNRSGDLFNECLREKVQSLWTSGRVFKALELIQETGIEVEAEKYLFINNDDQVFLKCMALDEMISPIDSNTFHSWLKAHSS
ncbi:MAG: hypothetical protein EBU93_08060, partial [Chlamydiae bacterium]|nr:hypothetical protein [Chlamydiota bacterium]